MRIGLIALSGVRVRNPELAALGVTLPGFVRRGKVIASLPSLGLLTVAGLTPRNHDVSYIEVADLKGSPPFPDFDLVGISSLSAQIGEAYSIADEYRKRGTKVVFGGLHTSMMTEEVLMHADSVVVGGAETAWPALLQDLERGHLKQRYAGATDRVFDPEKYAMPRFDLLSGREYNRITVQTSRGCPRNCEFCAASLTITDRFNQKPVELVMTEIREARKWFPDRFLELADDNTFLNKSWGREFLKQLRDEDLHWFTETDVTVAEDPGLCDLLAESGCRQLLIGFESPGATHLNGIDPLNWKQRQAPRYRSAIDELQNRGVSVNGCFILGLDSHDTSVFPMVRDFVRESGIAEVQVTVLTPFPGTPLYHRLKREGRLLKDLHWDRCTLFDVNYRPAKMTAEELESGMRWLFEELYSKESVSHRSRRFVRQSRQSNPHPVNGTKKTESPVTASAHAGRRVAG